MSIDLYFFPNSAPCRATRLTAIASGVKFNLKIVDLDKNEQLAPEFLKLNPQHTLPTVTDNGFTMWESRAIQQYLADKYSKSDSLYPKDPVRRALVNQRLYFDADLYSRFSDLYYPVVFYGAPASAAKDAAKVAKLEAGLGFLNAFLEGSKFAAGDALTIADHSLVCTVAVIEACGVDLTRWPNVARWFADCRNAIDDYEELNGKGAKQFGDAFHSKK